MNAAFRLEKKKVNQNELRRLMNEQKQSRTAEITNKIDSPFAKYENGQLSCVLCKSIVKTESVWKVHVNAKQHKENLALAKQLKEKIQSKTKKFESPEERIAGIKRSIEGMRSSEVPEKKLKGILKNSASSITSTTTIVVTKQMEDDENIQKSKVDNEQQQQQSKSTNSIPDDFFDSKPAAANKKSENKQTSEDQMEVDDPLPEGFFDDPVKDAKARNQEYKDPDEEEWNKFQKEIKEAEVQSKNIINEDHEEATVERQIDEIDEQIRNWSRVLEMEKKKEEIESKLKVVNPTQIQNDEAMKSSSDSESDEDEEIPEFIDWRAKKSHK